MRLVRNQKKITTIASTQGLDKLKYIADEDTTDEDNDVLGQTNAEEACAVSAVPEQQRTMSQATLEGSSKINQSLVPGQNDSPRSGNRLVESDQGVNNQSKITPDVPKKNMPDRNNQVIDQNPKVDNDPLKNSKDNLEATMKQLSENLDLSNKPLLEDQQEQPLKVRLEKLKENVRNLQPKIENLKEESLKGENNNKKRLSVLCNILLMTKEDRQQIKDNEKIFEDLSATIARAMVKQTLLKT